MDDSVSLLSSVRQQKKRRFRRRRTRGKLKKTDKVYAARLDTLRQNIKRVVFGILYGAAPKKISSIVGIPEDQADAIIKTLFNMFPSIVDYIKICK
jgi:DNA polymerase I-like protein with 3'-5' exonuclease and polymerase domains